MARLEPEARSTGGSAGAVVAGGRRVNTPRDDEGDDMDAASPATTAIVIAAR